MPLIFEPVKEKTKEDGILRELGIYKFDYHAPDGTPRDYALASKHLQSYVDTKNETRYLDTMRALSDDFFFFCYFVLDLPINDPFLIARAYEAQERCHNTLDLWSREFWKSTLLTYAMPIFELKENPDERIAIFSYNRAMSKKQMMMIKHALESNAVLKHAFQDVFYENPRKEAPKWALDEGIYVKRKKQYKEASVEAWGLIDNMPTGSHYTIRIYDDIIDSRNVGTLTQIEKAVYSYKMSQNLTARYGKIRGGKKRIIGTRYAVNDVYSDIMKQSNIKTRIYTCEVDEEGNFKRNGMPVFLNRDEIEGKYEELGDYIYHAQMAQNPVSEKQQKFKTPWLKYYEKLPLMNKYILVDPAGKKGEGYDYTVICVIGVDALKNYILVDMIRDRLELGDRWKKVRKMVTDHNVSFVGYESYGMQSDIDYFNMQMEIEGVFFTLEPLGGKLGKIERIKRLIPLYQNGRFRLPRAIGYLDSDNHYHELIYEFIEEEYKVWSPSYKIKHDDVLDCMSRVFDISRFIVFPTQTSIEDDILFKPDPLDMRESAVPVSWMN